MEKDVWDIRLFLFVRRVIGERMLICKEKRLTIKMLLYGIYSKRKRKDRKECNK